MTIVSNDEVSSRHNIFGSSKMHVFSWTEKGSVIYSAVGQRVSVASIRPAVCSLFDDIRYKPLVMHTLAILSYLARQLPRFLLSPCDVNVLLGEEYVLRYCQMKPEDSLKNDYSYFLAFLSCDVWFSPGSIFWFTFASFELYQLSGMK